MDNLNLNIFDFIVIVIIGFLCLFYFKENFSEHVEERIASNAKTYLVKVSEKSQEVADKLGRMDDKFLQIINILKNEYPNDPRTIFLDDNYDDVEITESTRGNGYTSYSVNKQKILFCLTANHSDGTLIDDNTLSYVGIHELAHLATEEIGHTETYWENFRWILSLARNNNLYTFEDYETFPKEYCGITISSNILN